jgi:hypothetical protein
VHGVIAQSLLREPLLNLKGNLPPGTVDREISYILDSICCPVFYLEPDVSESEFYLRLQSVVFLIQRQDDG